MEESAQSSSEAELYLSDKKFSYFVDEFKKDLATFERAKEWADLIKSLQKLTRVCSKGLPTNKQVLAKYPQYPVVPEKLIFCKRLAQCCNPSLPAGVHIKTLETYEIIFKRIGVRFISKSY